MRVVGPSAERWGNAFSRRGCAYPAARILLPRSERGSQGWFAAVATGAPREPRSRPAFDAGRDRLGRVCDRTLARMFSAVRGGDPEPDLQAHAVHAALRGGVSIRALVARWGHALLVEI